MSNCDRATFSRHTEGQLPRFRMGVGLVGEGLRERVAEYRHRLLEGDAMSSKVLGCLAGIPFEVQRGNLA